MWRFLSGPPRIGRSCWGNGTVLEKSDSKSDVRPDFRPHLIAPLSYLATAGYLAVWATQRQMHTLALVGLTAMGIPALASIAYCLIRRPNLAGAR